MAHIPISKMAAVLRDITERGRWVWVVSDDTVITGPDFPPTHIPEGRWEYHPSLREYFEDNAGVFNAFGKPIAAPPTDKPAPSTGQNFPPRPEK